MGFILHIIFLFLIILEIYLSFVAKDDVAIKRLNFFSSIDLKHKYLKFYCFLFHLYNFEIFSFFLPSLLESLLLSTLTGLFFSSDT